MILKISPLPAFTAIAVNQINVAESIPKLKGKSPYFILDYKHGQNTLSGHRMDYKLSD